MQTTSQKVQVRIGNLIERRSSSRPRTGSSVLLRRFLTVLLRSLSAWAV
jgi:hypothetical protein